MSSQAPSGYWQSQQAQPPSWQPPSQQTSSMPQGLPVQYSSQVQPQSTSLTQQQLQQLQQQQLQLQQGLNQQNQMSYDPTPPSDPRYGKIISNLSKESSNDLAAQKLALQRQQEGMQTGGNILDYLQGSYGDVLGANFAGKGGATQGQGSFDPNNNQSWAKFLAPTYSKVSQMGDQQMQALQRAMPRGGEQNSAMAQAIAQKYGALQGGWQGLVPQALQGLNSIGQAKYFQAPAYSGGTAAGTGVAANGQDLNYRMGTQGQNMNYALGNQGQNLNYALGTQGQDLNYLLGNQNAGLNYQLGQNGQNLNYSLGLQGLQNQQSMLDKQLKAQKDAQGGGFLSGLGHILGGVAGAALGPLGGLAGNGLASLFSGGNKDNQWSGGGMGFGSGGSTSGGGSSGYSNLGGM